MIKFRNVVAFMILGLALNCKSANENEEASNVNEITGSDSGVVSALSEDSYSYGCNGLGVRLLEGGPEKTRIQVSTVFAQGSGEMHCALFSGDHQTLQGLAADTYRVEDKSFTLTIPFSRTTCGNTYQLDCGGGLDAPSDGNYNNRCFIMSWAVGTFPCDKSYPGADSTPTPRPQCEEECYQVITPSPSPTMTPGSTPTPLPTVTPSPRPTPECQAPVGFPIICISTLGNPDNECSHFGLAFLGKDDNLSGSSHSASTDAILAIVKNGRGPCNQGQSSYRTYSNIANGQNLQKPLGAGDISHVTYCQCN